MVTLDVELYMFAVMVACGALLGMCFDAYRAVRAAWGGRGLAAVLQDLAFAALATAVLTVGLVVGAWGAFRLVVAVGAAVGLGLYATLASPTVYPVVHGVAAGVARAARAAAARGSAAARALRGRAAAVATAARAWSGLRGRVAGLAHGLGTAARALARALVRGGPGGPEPPAGPGGPPAAL